MDPNCGKSEAKVEEAFLIEGRSKVELNLKQTKRHNPRLSCMDESQIWWGYFLRKPRV